MERGTGESAVTANCQEGGGGGAGDGGVGVIGEGRTGVELVEKEGVGGG